MSLEKFAGLFAFFATVTTFLFGAFDVNLQILAVFIVLDFITGMLCGWYSGALSSRLGYRGVIKKAGILIVIIIANLLDVLTGAPLFRNASCVFLYSD